MQIILSATEKLTCLIAALCHLFNHVKQSASAPLLMLFNATFSQVLIIFILKSRLAEAVLFETGFSDYNFRKKAAQHAYNQEILDCQI